jgi:hypothetical protein
MKKITIEWDDKNDPSANFDGGVSMLEAIEQLTSLAMTVTRRLRAIQSPPDPHQEKRGKILVPAVGIPGNGKIRRG